MTNSWICRIPACDWRRFRIASMYLRTRRGVCGEPVIRLDVLQGRRGPPFAEGVQPDHLLAQGDSLREKPGVSGEGQAPGRADQGVSLAQLVGHTCRYTNKAASVGGRGLRKFEIRGDPSWAGKPSDGPASASPTRPSSSRVCRTGRDRRRLKGLPRRPVRLSRPAPAGRGRGR